jgi:6-hydroxycyclohex-1-ene-1-carbonyl-CoA dehydrogenase
VGLAELSVLADAMTTAFQSVVRSGLSEGDMCVVVGAGGVGGFAVQIAAAFGATVAALDVDEERLRELRDHGAERTLVVRGREPGDVRKELRDFARERGLPSREWKIFETSGTTAGQALAFRLLNHGAHLSVVGFAPAEVTVRLSNLMALDASASGNWGCLPDRYPQALSLVMDGRVAVKPFVETRPLDQVQEVLEQLEAGALKRRVVLVPEHAS